MTDMESINAVSFAASGGRIRPRWTAAERLRIVQETFCDVESISAVARRNWSALKKSELIGIKMFSL